MGASQGKSAREFNEGMKVIGRLPNHVYQMSYAESWPPANQPSRYEMGLAIAAATGHTLTLKEKVNDWWKVGYLNTLDIEREFYVKDKDIEECFRPLTAKDFDTRAASQPLRRADPEHGASRTYGGANLTLSDRKGGKRRKTKRKKRKTKKNKMKRRKSKRDPR
jgi:hypothetical protein